MTYAIYKYPLGPRNVGFIYADVQKWLDVKLDPGGNPCIWALVRTDERKVEKRFRYSVLGTGWDLNPADIQMIGDYMGTWVEGNGVWHCFIQEENEDEKED